MAGETTDVIFRVWHTKNAEPFALFPGLPGTNDPSTCLSYARVGQHSSADPAGCVRRSRPATPEEYAPLMAELIRAGYALVVCHQCVPRHYRQRCEQVAR